MKDRKRKYNYGGFKNYYLLRKIRTGGFLLECLQS